MLENRIQIPRVPRTNFLPNFLYFFFIWPSTRLFSGLLMALRDPKVYLFILLGCFANLGTSFTNFFPTLVSSNCCCSIESHTHQLNGYAWLPHHYNTTIGCVSTNLFWEELRLNDLWFNSPPWILPAVIALCRLEEQSQCWWTTTMILIIPRGTIW